MIKKLKLLWDFGRPHTLIGSTLSITTLYLLSTGKSLLVEHISIYLLTLLSALACNIFITGLNQIIDVEMDKINKPFLPIAAGRLTIASAYVIIYVSLFISLILALLVHIYFFDLIVIIILIGVAYSVPPIRLKQHHLPASLSIVLVRGFLVNLGIGLFFEYYIHDLTRTGTVLIPLTIFMMAFSFAIAWFKDLYDVKGDELYQVKTLAVLYSIPFAYALGNTMVILAYLFNMGYAYLKQVSNWEFLFGGHLLMLLAYLALIVKSTVTDREGIYKFYMSIWVFFFIEYILYATYSLL